MEPNQEAPKQETQSADANAATPNNAQQASATPSAAPSATENVDALKARIAELEGQVKEKENKHLYLYAEFENFKKRSIKERSDLIKFGWENVARELLQVADNLERALAHTPPGTDKALVDGLNMILNHFRSTLSQQGVQPIESVSKPFDPNFHEALAQAPSKEPAGTILQEHTRGYTLHGRLLRPSRVVVSTGQPASNGHG